MANFTPRPTPLRTGRIAKLHYTVREVFEALAFELNKVSAPFVDVETFNHFLQTARSNYYKKRYNLYDSGQQTTDDLSDISASTLFSASTTPPLVVGQEQFPYPPDYFHMLAVDVFWKVKADFRNFRKDDIINFAAERTAADRLTMIRQDHYNRPRYSKVYFLARRDYVELHSGKHENLTLYQVLATYLMQPEEVTLFETDLDDLTTDPSQVLKEKGVITEEILKELTTLVLENQGNPRTAGKNQVDQAVPSQPPQTAPAPAPRGQR